MSWQLRNSAPVSERSVVWRSGKCEKLPDGGQQTCGFSFPKPHSCPDSSTSLFLPLSDQSPGWADWTYWFKQSKPEGKSQFGSSGPFVLIGGGLRAADLSWWMGLSFACHHMLHVPVSRHANPGAKRAWPVHSEAHPAVNCLYCQIIVQSQSFYPINSLPHYSDTEYPTDSR